MLLQHTDSVHQRELKRPVFHTNLAEQRGSASLTKVSATSMRTAEVTICIIPEGLLDRPRQLPHAWKPRWSKTTSTVSLPSVSNVLLMVVHHDIRTEPTHEINAISHHSSRAENFGQLDSNETRANLASRHDDRGFRGSGAPASCRHCKLVPPTTEIVPTFHNDNQEGLSVVRLQVLKAHWAYAPHPARCPTPQNHTSGRNFRPPRRRHPPCLCQRSPRNTRSQTL